MLFATGTHSTVALLSEAVFSLLISTTGKRVFQTSRALAVIIAYHVCSVYYNYYGKEIYLILVHFNR